ncbi:hypothetical protein GCM10011316_09060 [Roseibium aquae]|uniref:Uncharacterized protein n=1 Tax=Roseibium aquae TaxID=1323746 RepID=A0A916TBQ7_9HYPH|nr:hypothetical protein [Roseibium aquae]GGB39209.1 hypothetical protein GCM10011316_09060 [Roseibium aquae]
MQNAAPTIDVSRKAERLVVEGIRRSMAAHATGDYACFDLALKLYEAELGPRDARRTLSDLCFYARALALYGNRSFCLFPYECPRLCQDECLVAALIAAEQSGNSSISRKIAEALVTSEGQSATLYAASSFANALSDCALHLSPIDFTSLRIEACPLRRAGLGPRH